MLKLKLVIVVSFTVLLLALTGCRGMVAPPEATTLTVMTYNVYVGSSAEELLATMNQAEIPGKVAELYGNVMQSDFPARAAAIARIVKESQPHVIGLQEISLIRKQVPGDSLVNPQPNAEEVALDFLAVLQVALQAEGLSYAVAGKVENVDIEMPMLTATGWSTWRLTDYDVILARNAVAVSNPMTATYQDRAAYRAPRSKFLAARTAVRCHRRRRDVPGVNTHLEAFNQLPRVAQMQELVASLSAETLPVILLGDFNTAAPDGTAYQLLLEAEYSDVWQADSEGTGNTCCQDADLMNEESDLGKRIDQIFIRSEGRCRHPHRHRRRQSRGQDARRPLAIGPRGGGRAPAGRRRAVPPPRLVIRPAPPPSATYVEAENKTPVAASGRRTTRGWSRTCR